MTAPGLLTVADYATDEFVEKKSRFIGHIMPVESEAAAVAFVEKIKKEHRAATHNCYAWLVGAHDELQRSADAGEPAGTAGRPILEAVKHAGLHNTALVVTRYFGGVLLGAGGLTRAYARAAQVAIIAATHVLQLAAKRFVLSFDYALLSKVESILAKHEVCIERKLYAEQVSFICLQEESKLADLAVILADASAGSLHWQDLAETAFLEKIYKEAGSAPPAGK